MIGRYTMGIGVISVLLLYLINHLVPALSQVTFRYDNFSGPELVADLNLSGDANVSNGALFLTGDRYFSYGRAVRRETVKLCNSSGFMASFVSEFTFQIEKKLSWLPNADGFAFMLARNASPPSNKSFGRWMGLFDENTNGLLENRLAAVEFDTFKNTPEEYPGFQDRDRNHVGLNLNNMYSVNWNSLFPFQIILGSGMPLAATVDYDARALTLRVYMSDNVTRSRVGIVVLEHRNFNICTTISEKSFVGFSAGSGSANVDFHKILSWSFNSSELFLPLAEADGRGSDTSRVVIIGASLSSAFLLLLTIAGVASLVAISRRRQARANDLVQLPHGIPYGDLSLATDNFSSGNVLGRGGFGSVYRGILPKDQSLVAVKRIAKDSQQGEREFLAEVQIISQLSHRNLVKLRGWCRQKKELILVYDYMPRGSLDRALFDDSESVVLSWEIRYRILCGLAAALLYIHEDWEQQVVHRDIKCSNVMLDADFNARLGDFGLARAFERGGDNMESTTIAGTLGYMAPEVLGTFTFTPATDTYSFGVVALEVVCGRNVVMREPGGGGAPCLLIPWVQECYRNNRLLDAVDPRLSSGGSFDAGEAVRALKTALMCVDLNPTRRPSMRSVHFILTGDISLTV